MGGFTVIPTKISDAAETEFRVMLADFGTSVTVAGETAFAMIAVDDQVLEGEGGFGAGSGSGTQKRGEVVGRQIVATVITNDFDDGVLAIDAAIQINDGNFAGSYSISNRLLAQHVGLSLTKLYLRRE